MHTRTYQNPDNVDYTQWPGLAIYNCCYYFCIYQSSMVWGFGASVISQQTTTNPENIIYTYIYIYTPQQSSNSVHLHGHIRTVYIYIVSSFFSSGGDMKRDAPSLSVHLVETWKMENTQRERENALIASDAIMRSH